MPPTQLLLTDNTAPKTIDQVVSQLEAEYQNIAQQVKAAQQGRAQEIANVLALGKPEERSMGKLLGETAMAILPAIALGIFGRGLPGGSTPHAFTALGAGGRALAQAQARRDAERKLQLELGLKQLEFSPLGEQLKALQEQAGEIRKTKREAISAGPIAGAKAEAEFPYEKQLRAIGATRITNILPGTPISTLSPPMQHAARAVLQKLNIPATDEQISKMTVGELEQIDKMAGTIKPPQAATQNVQVATSLLGQIRDSRNQYKQLTAEAEKAKRVGDDFGKVIDNIGRAILAKIPSVFESGTSERVFESGRGMLAFTIARAVSKGTQSDQDIARAEALLPRAWTNRSQGEALFKRAERGAELAYKVTLAEAGKRPPLSKKEFDEWINIQAQLNLTEAATRNLLMFANDPNVVSGETAAPRSISEAEFRQSPKALKYGQPGTPEFENNIKQLKTRGFIQ